jgi:NitT/TauT family transport system substrate-binding protein
MIRPFFASATPSRRDFMGAAAAFASGLTPLAASAQNVAPGLKLKLGWSGSGVCLISVPVAERRGLFVKHGLDVEMVKFGANFDSSLESVASGKVDATVNFILRFLKPLEQGINIKFTGAVHGGCIRVLAPTEARIGDYRALKGKAIGISSMASAARSFTAIQLKKAGVDPDRDVEWRVFPADILGEAVRRGEVFAAADADPAIYLQLQNSNGALTEIGGLSDGIYRDLACCGIAVRSEFIAENKPAAAALTRALLEAATWVHHNPDEAADLFTAYSPLPRATLAEIIRSHTHGHNFGDGTLLKKEVRVYADDLKAAGILKPRTDPAVLSDRVVADVLS